MAKVFYITPKRTIRRNGQVLTPEMSLTVTTQSHCLSPFNNGAKEVKEAYQRIYNFDYQRCGCSSGDFTFDVLG